MSAVEGVTRMPTNEQLIQMAKKYPPPPEWWDEDHSDLFDRSGDDVRQSGPEPLDEIGCADLALREIKLTEEQAVAIERIKQDDRSGPRCAPKLCDPWPLDDVGE